LRRAFGRLLRDRIANEQRPADSIVKICGDCNRTGVIADAQVSTSARFGHDVFVFAQQCGGLVADAL
jgi:hypothetical protein